MRIERTVKLLLLALAGMALAAPAVAQAEPVNQFNFQVTDIKPGGRFTLLFHATTFDTTGGVPPTPTANYLRIPKGATLRREFLNRRYFCDGPKLRTDIDTMDFSGTPFTKNVQNLKPFIRRLSHNARSTRAKKALANAQTCDRARIGGGTVRVDARGFSPKLDDLIRGTFAVFFSKGSRPGAVAGFTVLGAADEDQEIVKRRTFEVLTGVHVALNADFFNDPTPDGLFGYRLDLPPGDVNGIKVSLAELNVTTRGLTLLKGTCLKQNARGRCVKRQGRSLFWFTIPPCPASGKFSFQEFFGYEPPIPNSTNTVQFACPRFIQ
ncbi:MAG TPA: hypothetical protein VGO48_10065 [Conexibacter sp.]|jgi:hypothetical protein|nr:hypothetical protein [Conexibacter sp.]